MLLRGLKDVSWNGAKAMMADGGFLKSLVEFDKDGLNDKQVKAVKSYFKDKDFNLENLKNISKAGSGAWPHRCLGCCSVLPVFLSHAVFAARVRTDCHLSFCAL